MLKQTKLILTTCLCLTIVSFNLLSQDLFQYTHQDSLKGSITPERAWWDVNHYNLSVQVFPERKYITGENQISFTVLEEMDVMQIDLQPPMRIDSIIFEGNKLSYDRDGFAWFAKFPKKLSKEKEYHIKVYYQGAPRESLNAPWVGGFSWKSDKDGNHFIATSNQGEGASLWWPCKDHYYDEADSLHISVRVPQHLTDVSNGQLLNMETHADSTRTFHWFVNNPINNYGVNINIANYEHFSEVYNGENGPLSCDYYVLPHDLQKAKEQFKEVKKMFEAFEYWLGPYPFYEDGFKLVQVPYLGMEHQSSVTYGNKFMKGYLGRDFSGSGWGLKFDYIIIHESGHEWFANNITCKDVADLWLHEGFTAYSESLFLDYHYGKDASNAYVVGTRSDIRNDRPVIGPYGVGKEGSVDMYYKGANIIHTIRHLVDDDELWRNTLRKMNKKYYHAIVTSSEIENFIQKETGLNLLSFFDQYLRTTMVPVLEYKIQKKKLTYRWNNVLEGFDMPVKIRVANQLINLCPGTQWSELKLDKRAKSIELDPNFFVESKQLH